MAKNYPRGLDPARDCLLQAVAKFGGLARHQVAARFGLRPEELRATVRVGNLKAWPFRAAGRPIDDVAELLAEAGYFPGLDPADWVQAMGDAIAHELSGGQVLTPEGHAHQLDEAARLEYEAVADDDIWGDLLGRPCTPEETAAFLAGDPPAPAPVREAQATPCRCAGRPPLKRQGKPAPHPQKLGVNPRFCGFTPGLGPPVEMRAPSGNRGVQWKCGPRWKSGGEPPPGGNRGVRNCGPSPAPSKAVSRSTSSAGRRSAPARSARTG